LTLSARLPILLSPSHNSLDPPLPGAVQFVVFSQFAMHTEARDQLVLGHLNHVYFIARQIHRRLPRQVLLEDLVHAGVVGLLDAMEKFDPAKNITLKSYAQFRIRGAILDSLREGDWSPRKLRRQARRLDQAISACESRLGRVPTEEEIAGQLEISLDDLRRLIRDLDGLEIQNIQQLFSAGAMAEKLVATSSDDDPFSVTVRSEMVRLLAKAIAELSEREREVLSLYHFKELPMKAVGSALGIGASRVSQIHSAALVRLRERLKPALAPRSSPALARSR